MLASEEKYMELTPEDFELALNPTAYGFDGDWTEYFSVHAEYRGYGYKTDNKTGKSVPFSNKEYLPVSVCGNNSFLEMNSTKESIKLESMYCIPKRNYTLLGDFTSQSANFIKIIFSLCNQTTLDQIWG